MKTLLLSTIILLTGCEGQTIEQKKMENAYKFEYNLQVIEQCERAGSEIVWNAYGYAFCK